ncbi:uncharacterized protein LOC108735771 [Agrilus planipennis]|uniref:Uncharacterized protein LOC108735771 n=1 Tax=Agrilus planipennis TaxID=224129 RepID=A0A1W4WTE7_AGRPL|nr:uncharacterized protein LOC108735771 [Agrilus planipennis]
MCNYTFLCVLLICISAFSSGQRNLYLPPDLPQDIMVDVINNFGVELLKKHNEYNENNLALSPYGAISVLVALKEGTRGVAQNEIQQTLHLPYDPSTVRIGLRDVLRRLKTYFIPEEGFLAGLTFNNDNISLKSDYRDLLMFYGYDVGSFNKPLYPSTTTENTTGSDLSRTTETSSSTTTKSTETPLEEEIETTITTFVPIENMLRTTTLSMTESTTEIELRQISAGMTPSTTKGINTAEEATTVISTLSPTSEETTISTLVTFSSTESLGEPSTLDMETTTSSTFSTASTNREIESTILSITPSEMNTFSPISLNFTENASDSVTSSTYFSSTEGETSIEDITTIPITSTTHMPQPETPTPAKLKKRTSSKRKRSPYSNTPSKYYLPSNTNSDIRQNQQSPSKINYEVDPSVISFLVDGKTRETNISFMTYKAILPYCYIPNLKSLALSFPLDSENYYLLIILPLDDCGADFVLERIGYDITLRDIVASLTFTYVKATIPSFMLKGTVLLTPTLQKMGITSVFEPKKADFSEMTEAKEIYVTNIEQLITVRIRNYIDPNQLDYFGNHYYQQNPVWFKADHPFLYFVMDSRLHVSLMAGKITNPLNSRIS